MGFEDAFAIFLYCDEINFILAQKVPLMKSFHLVLNGTQWNTKKKNPHKM